MYVSQSIFFRLVLILLNFVFTPSSLAHRTQKITQTQLDMIASSDVTLANLGWASITSALKNGAVPNTKQLTTIQENWERLSLSEGTSAISQLFSNGLDQSTLSAFVDQNRRFALLEKMTTSLTLESFNWDSEENRALLKSKNLIDQEMMNQLEMKGALEQKPYHVADFIKDAPASTFTQVTPFPINQPPSTSFVTSPTSANLSLRISPGSVHSNVETNVTHSTDNNHGHFEVRIHLSPFRTEALTLEQLLRNDELNRMRITADHFTTGLGFSSAAEAATSECVLYRVNQSVQIISPLEGNSSRSDEEIAQASCMRFASAPSPAMDHAKVSRFTLNTVGLTQLPTPGSFTNPQNLTPTLHDSLAWYDSIPTFEASVDYSVAPESPWIAIRVSRTADPATAALVNPLINQYPASPANVECETGCLTKKPILRIGDDWVLFGSAGTGIARMKFSGPIPFNNAAPMPPNMSAPASIHFDILEPSSVLVEDAEDPSTLPRQTQEIKNHSFQEFLTLWSNALKTSSWFMPKLDRPETEGLLALHRFELMNELLSSPGVKKFIPRDADSLEFRLSILAAFTRQNLPRLEEFISQLHQSHIPLVALKELLDTSVQSLGRLSQEKSYQLLGQLSDTLLIEKPTVIQSKRELEEAVIGASELATESEANTRLKLKLLCNAIQNLTLPETLTGPNVLLQPKTETLSICKNINSMETTP